MAQFENWGDYFWDDQIDECKRNRHRLDIDDVDRLEAVERDYTARRAAELESGRAQVSQTLDLEHVEAIHAHSGRV